MSDLIKQQFEDRLAEHARDTEAFLDDILTGELREDEIARPARLLQAMRHGVLNGGKRLRPFLVIETARMLGLDSNIVYRVAAALECVHCYSLIHDDLPAMDDDDLRRGQPTVHKAFDEATAILAGDALLTLAFDLLADGSRYEPRDGEFSDRQQLDLIRGLSRAAGLGGMVGGQMLDLEAETKTPDETGIVQLQAMKTGALIRYACEAGAIAANATRADRERMVEFGAAIGLAFQLADDLLDRTATVEAMGKATGKDAAAGKGTLVALHGENWARSQLGGLVEQAEALLEPYGEYADVLKQAARFIAERSR